MSDVRATCREEDVLVINTYGGSLIIGAKLAGANVIGSLEDANFGVTHQHINFPDLEIVPKVPWPELDLEDVWVLAHPPCSAFSLQTPKHRKGEDSDAFACHRRVINYSLGARCRGLALESVPGAIRALSTYEEMAVRYGYSLSVLRVNSCSFGVPQWRPRVWFVFHRDAPTRATLAAPKNYAAVRDCIHETGTELKIKNCRPLAPEHWGLMTGEHSYGRVTKMYRAANPAAPTDEYELKKLCGRAPGEFASRIPRLLDPDGLAPVLMSDVQWFVAPGGVPRRLFLEEYCAIMGFPTDYQWPVPEKSRLFLSKGVCPPVAAWVLQKMVGGVMLADNDLLPKKADVLRALVRS